MLDNGKCLIIGEVGQAHDGSLGMAHSYIDAIADAGADAVKFQTHIADAESTPDEQWRTKFSPKNETRFEYWKRMEFSEEEWIGLRGHADERKIKFLSSPFSVEAVELLERVGVPAWKVASGEVFSVSMLNRMLQTKKALLLSTGMMSLQEIDETTRTIKEAGVPLALFQCTSSYPCSAKEIGLNLIPFFRERYRCPVGLSDHSGKIFPSLAAAGVGAQLIEVHVTFSRAMFGPDVSSSITLDELKTLVEGIRYTEEMLAHPVDKDGLSQRLKPMRNLFSKSLTARTAIRQGAVIREEYIVPRKPGSGIPESRISDVLGCIARRDIPENKVLSPDDLEGFEQ